MNIKKLKNGGQILNLPQRKSIRLKGYDYSQAGLYFVTIVTQNRKNLFGEIQNGKMILNDTGNMVEKWYYELENKYHDIKCREMVVMPNHFHCIIQNISENISVGADLRVCPDNITDNITDETISGEISGEYTGSPLHRVVQWFKTMTTNEYIRGVKNKNWKPFNGKLWQRNYWEHVIRNKNEYQRISQYIIDNPIKWENDKLNGGNGNIIMEPQVEYNSEIWMI